MQLILRWQALAAMICLSIFALPALGADVANNPQPNILWITAEDMSPTLGCYGDTFATSPNIDALAAESTRYSHAFATAPVCSPSRACLINGCIATTQGTHPMRSTFPLPDDMLGFPTLLRGHGYYTTNNVKTDYNSAAEERIIEHAWDDNSESAHWRNRPEGKPFFSVFNLMTSHQSRTMVWPYEQFQREIQGQLSGDQIHDPAEVPVPPYYPDTPQVRKTIARYYDCVTVMDKQVGELLRHLEEDGLADDTIVFFYSDHGSGMPRHKRALFDSGMQVPMLIRFPEKYQYLAPTPPGEWTDRLVSFEDFAPTVLSLAGIESLPEYMRGTAFLGPLRGQAANYLFGHRDRVDEAVDMARSVRSGDYLYIRNYMPHLGYHQPSAWADQGAIRAEFDELVEAGTANAAQAQYVSPTRPIEELYDCTNDPMNLNNLVDSREHREVLKAMRTALRQHIVESRDLGFVPEIELWNHADGTTPMEWAEQSGLPIEQLYSAASLVGTQSVPDITIALSDGHVAVRYWAAIASTTLENLPEELRHTLREKLKDPSPAVQIAAADALARHGHPESAYEVLEQLVQHDDQTIVLHAARTLELLGDSEHRGLMLDLHARFEEAPGDIAWFIRFSTTGFLNRVDD